MFPFEKIKVQWQLIKAKNRYQKIEKASHNFKRTEKYKALKGQDKYNEDQWMDFESYEAYSEVEVIKTEIFSRELSKYDIPVPSRFKEGEERDKYWTGGPHEEYEYFTREGDITC